MNPRTHGLTLLAATSLLGCRPEEAPNKFEEMMVYGFTHMGDEDTDAIQALSEKIEPWVNNNFDDTSDGYEIASLGEDELAMAGIDKSIDAGVLGVAVGLDFTVDLEDLTMGITYKHQEEIYDNYIEFERTEHTDLDCFLGGDCETHEVTDYVYSTAGLGITFEAEFDVGFRKVKLEDGSTVTLRRMLGPNPSEFNSDIITVNQQYSFSYCYEKGGHARRVEAMWADGELLSSDSAEGAYLALTITTMKSSAEKMDAWLTAQ